MYRKFEDGIEFTCEICGKQGFFFDNPITPVEYRGEEILREQDFSGWILCEECRSNRLSC
jgi:hypothetical protein